MPYPEIQTQLFAVVFILALALSIKPRESKLIFPVSLTEELKGLAILGVIFAHISYGLYWGSNFLFPFAIWGGVCVNLFFFLSGFGLAASAIKKQIKPLEYYRRRLSKIYLPLWLSLIAVLLIDFFALGRTYPLTEVINGFAGFFPTADMFKSINSPLWFLTPLIFFYLTFPLVYRAKHPFISAVFVAIISLVVFWPSLQVSSQVQDFYKVHFLAFPLGVFLAGLVFRPLSLPAWVKNFGGRFTDLLAYWQQRPAAKKAFNFLKQSFARNGILVALFAFLAYYTAVYSGVGKGNWAEGSMALLTMAFLVAVFCLKKFDFGLLRLLGVYSFEIYLLHWPLLARYDFLFNNLPVWVATLIYLPILLLLAWCFKWLETKLSRLIFKKSAA